MWMQYVELVLISWKIWLCLNDPMALTEALVNMFGIGMIAMKSYEHQNKADTIVQLTHDLDAMFCKFRDTLPPKMQACTRMCFIENFIVNYSSGFLLAPGLVLASIITPIILWEPVLMYPSQFPWDATTPIGYTIAVTFQLFIMTWRLVSILHIDSLGVGMLHYSNLICKIITHQMQMLWHNDVIEVKAVKAVDQRTTKDGTKKTEESKLNEEFVEIVQEHQSLMRLVKSLNKTMSNCYVIQVVCSTFMLCLAGFQMVMGLQQKDLNLVINYSVFFVAALSQLIFWCYNGNKIYWTVRCDSDTQLVR